MLLLLPGLLLMPINYGFAVTFITAAVGMLFTSSGDQADFIRYRVAENAIGVRWWSWSGSCSGGRGRPTGG